MQILDSPAPPQPLDKAERDDLARQIRQLEERLAFYEGFDTLIQDNITHARELFRTAALERETAAANAARVRWEAEQRDASLRAEFASIASDLAEVRRIVDGLATRVDRALSEAVAGGSRGSVLSDQQPVAVVVHGVASAQAALSIQHFMETLPHVRQVSAREFVGGVLRLDATVSELLRAEQFARWDRTRRLQILTERPDVIEIALRDPEAFDQSG